MDTMSAASVDNTSEQQRMYQGQEGDQGQTLDQGHQSQGLTRDEGDGGLESGSPAKGSLSRLVPEVGDIVAGDDDFINSPEFQRSESSSPAPSSSPSSSSLPPPSLPSPSQTPPSLPPPPRQTKQKEDFEKGSGTDEKQQRQQKKHELQQDVVTSQVDVSKQSADDTGGTPTSKIRSVHFASPPLSNGLSPPPLDSNANNYSGVVGPGGSHDGSGSGGSSEQEKAEDADSSSHKGCYWFSLRYVVVWLVFCGMVVINAMRTNVAVSVLPILDRQTHAVHNQTGELREIPSVDWNTEMIGYLHSIFYVGYLLTHLPGGYLTTRLPSHKIFGVCILVSSVLNLFLPVAIELGGYAVTLLLRFSQGLSEGLLYPSMYGVLRHWTTSQERSRAGSLVLTGAYVGPAIGFPIAGVITDYLGWDYIYYVNGLMGVLFVLVWTWVSEEKPAHHSKMSPDELKFIERLQGSETFDYEGMDIPWRAIMKSPAVWSLCVCHIARNWVFIFMLTNEPFYLNMFKFSIAQNGAISAVPHVLKMTASLTSGLIADMVLKKKFLSTTRLRKILTTGFGIQSLMFLMLTFTTDGAVAMVLLTCAIGAGGFVVSGWQLNHYDLSVRHASVLVAITSTFGNTASIIAPIVCGYLTAGQTFQGWYEMFYITSFLTGLAWLSFLICGSGERQPWADPPDASRLVIKEDKRRRRPYTPSTASATSSSSSASSPALPSFSYSALRGTGDDATASHVPNYGSQESTLPVTPSSEGSDITAMGDGARSHVPR